MEKGQKKRRKEKRPCGRLGEAKGRKQLCVPGRGASNRLGDRRNRGNGEDQTKNGGRGLWISSGAISERPFCFLLKANKQGQGKLGGGGPWVTTQQTN